MIGVIIVVVGVRRFRKICIRVDGHIVVARRPGRLFYSVLFTTEKPQGAAKKQQVNEF
jgi:hypothetical protein